MKEEIFISSIVCNGSSINNVDNPLALSTGLRYGELIGLCINDLDFKNNRIKVHRQWKYKEGGGFGPLKTEKSERTISIDKLTMDALKKHLITVKNDPANEHN